MKTLIVVLSAALLVACGSDPVGPSAVDDSVTGLWHGTIDSTFVELTIREADDGSIAGCVAVQGNGFEILPAMGQHVGDDVEITTPNFAFTGQKLADGLSGSATGPQWLGARTAIFMPGDSARTACYY